MTLMQILCKNMINEFTTSQLNDAFNALTEIKKLPKEARVSFMGGIPIYDMGNPAHMKRLTAECGHKPNAARQKVQLARVK